jgi:hypothetical protein
MVLLVGYCRCFPGDAGKVYNQSKMLRSHTKVNCLPGSEAYGRNPALTLPHAKSTVLTNRYLRGEKSVGRMYVTSTFSTSLLACSALMTS